MGCEAVGFGRDLGIDLVRTSVVIVEDVVLVIEFGEPLRQGQFMSVALVKAGGEPPGCQLASKHAACERSGGVLSAGIAGDRVEGEAEFVECFGSNSGTS